MTSVVTPPAIAPAGGRRMRRRPVGAAGVAAAAGIALLAIATAGGPIVWGADPDRTNLLDRFAGASGAHPLGTDDFGRDLLARLISGGRRSLVGATIVLGGSTGLGLLVGGTAGAVGHRLDALLSRLIDTLLSLPSLIIAMAIVGVFGKSYPNLLIALVATGWPWYARLYRSFVVKERHETYVLAAAAIGASRFRIAWRHIGPNIAGPALVLGTVNFGNAVLGLASLSFLGLGVQPPTAEWGAMVNDARTRFQSHPWIIIAPGAAISLTVISVNLLGDALHEWSDPRRRRH